MEFFQESKKQYYKKIHFVFKKSIKRGSECLMALMGQLTSRSMQAI